MKEHEEMLLTDAIETAINAEKRASIYKVTTFCLLAIVAILIRK